MDSIPPSRLETFNIKLMPLFPFIFYPVIPLITCPALSPLGELVSPSISFLVTPGDFFRYKIVQEKKSLKENFRS